MMRYAAAAVLGSVVLTVAATGGVAILATGEPRGPTGPMIAQPISSPRASVAPEVAREMNGPQGKVTMAGGITMRPATPADRHRLAGNGQGNGCVVGYGEPGQCLPLQSPAQAAMPDMDHPWTCPEVRDLFPRGLVVLDEDTLGLDPDGDGVACGGGHE